MTNSRDEGLTCNGCGKSFENKETLGLHKKRSGPAHNVRPECNVCKKQFSHGSNVLRHMMIHTGEHPFCFVCFVCSVCFVCFVCSVCFSVTLSRTLSRALMSRALNITVATVIAGQVKPIRTIVSICLARDH